MILKELIFLIWSDLDRYHPNPNMWNFLREILVGQGFKYFLWFRLNQYLSSKAFWWAPWKLIGKFILHHYSYKFVIDISQSAEIGPGLKIEHFGGIFVSGQARIGKRCTLCQGVTIGAHNGAPKVGDFVFIGPGAKVLNDIRVGSNAIIGANCVVTKDVPENAVVVGVPGKVISLQGNLRGERLDEAIKLIERYKMHCPRSCWPRFMLL